LSDLAHLNLERTCGRKRNDAAIAEGKKSNKGKKQCTTDGCVRVGFIERNHPDLKHGEGQKTGIWGRSNKKNKGGEEYALESIHLPRQSLNPRKNGKAASSLGKEGGGLKEDR